MFRDVRPCWRFEVECDNMDGASQECARQTLDRILAAAQKIEDAVRFEMLDVDEAFFGTLRVDDPDRPNLFVATVSRTNGDDHAVTIIPREGKYRSVSWSEDGGLCLVIADDLVVYFEKAG